MYIVVALMIVVLVTAVYTIMLLIQWKLEDTESALSPYECGFETLSVTRYNFSYRFFLISILFLIFDVEIVLMLPAPFVNIVILSMKFLLAFVITLLVGVLYEMNFGTLTWLS